MINCISYPLYICYVASHVLAVQERERAETMQGIYLAKIDDSSYS